MLIKNFTDLITWQKAHKFSLIIYHLTKKFPKEERFSLTDQIRRAAISITSNIAEGFGRKSNKEKNYFFYIAKGSLTEVQNQLIFAKDVNYIQQETHDKAYSLSIEVHKLLNGLIKALDTRY